jgi:hypothetical protein
MSKSQGISRDNRGEEQPADKDRAQTAHRTGFGEPSPSKEETRKGDGTCPARPGHSNDR